MLPTKLMQQTKQDTLQWFYQQAKENRLTGTAQRLWYWLFTQLSMVQPDRFYEISSRVLATELGVCLKSIERSRKALQQAGLLHYEVRGKSVYYRLLVSAVEIDNEARGVASAPFCADSADPYWDDDTMTTAQQLAELTAKLEEYAQQIAQLQAQLAEQTQNTSVISTELAHTSALEKRSGEIFPSCHLERSREIFTPEQEKPGILDYARNASDSAQDDYISPTGSIVNNHTSITNSQEYTAYKQKQQHQPDILFNDKYEILLWDYLNKYKDNRFAEACYNHFIMLKEIYQHKGKKKLTKAGFYNIMNELEQLSGYDMTLKLAIMERSLRNRWTGFFALPDNTPEYKKTEKKKQGRKRVGCGVLDASLYRNGSGRSQYRSYYDSFQPREGRDLEYLVQ